MTREETKEVIRIMQAYVDGKEIEQLNNFTEYIPTTSPRWNWINNISNYRVKPEPHYRPFKSAEEVMEAIMEHGYWVKQSGYEHYDRICRVESGNLGTFDIGYISLENAFEELTFFDGTPFGKLVED